MACRQFGGRVARSFILGIVRSCEIQEVLWPSLAKWMLSGARRCTCTFGCRKTPLELMKLHLCFRPARHTTCLMKCANHWELRCC
ncbi:unnamed protein product [Prunus armeniaca]